MKQLLLSCSLFLLCPFLLSGQPIVQAVRGVVIDKETLQPLPGAVVTVANTAPQASAVADANGRFVLEAVPVGRRSFLCQYLGYAPYRSDEMIVSSARGLELAIALEKRVFTTTEVEVSALNFPSEPANRLALASSRSFTAEETERTPAGVYDPGRMALSFPGVQQGIDENENKIIVRGNSSVGVLWRLEGIDLPNPNHFASPGSSGGGITIFSSQLLGRSDFLTGAFPANYGNALSGVFDVHFRKGNFQERAHWLRASLIGLDVATEGPLKKGRSSYLANYRYSTLGVLNRLGVNLVGERVDNTFQDFSFNLAFDNPDRTSSFTVFGIAGNSEERYFPLDPPEDRDLTVVSHWEDRTNSSRMGAVGMTYTRLLNDRSYIKTVVAGAGSLIIRSYDTLNTAQARFNYDQQEYREERLSASTAYYHKYQSGVQLATGLIFHEMFYNFFKSNFPRRTSNITAGQPQRRISINGKGNTRSIQAYANATFRIGEKLEGNAGLHTLFFALNNSWSVEPRASLRYRPAPRQSVTLAYGLHSKILPFSAYFYAPEGNTSAPASADNPNYNLSLIKAHHLVLAYKYQFANSMRAVAEVYGQRLFDVPAGTGDNSEYWMLNDQGRLLEFVLTSRGKGWNYGIDLALERSFYNQLFFLLTASFFDSKFEVDGFKRNTRFNSRFVSTFTVGREFQLTKRATLQAGTRLMANGGFRYSPHDPEQSLARGGYVPLKGAEWSGQVGHYYRLDGRAALRKNASAFSYTLSLDIQNMTNRFNPHSVRYNATTNELQFRRHSGGLVPVLSYSMDF